MVQEFLNVGLLALLVVLMYNKNTFLNNTVTSTIGKMMWVVSIVFVSKYVNKTSGLILAVILMMVLNQTKEYFSNIEQETEEEDGVVLKESTMNIPSTTVMNTTDLDRTMKKNSELNTISSSSE